MRDRLAPLSESAGIELVATAAPASVVIPEQRLEQLLVNLVRNALRATGAGGGSRITISVEPEGGLSAVTVEDDGPGMAAEELPRAFERFYRGGSAATRESGSGLGLTIARELSSALGGRIDLESEVGRGSRFELVLPA